MRVGSLRRKAYLEFTSNFPDYASLKTMLFCGPVPFPASGSGYFFLPFVGGFLASPLSNAS